MFKTGRSISNTFMPSEIQKYTIYIVNIRHSDIFDIRNLQVSALSLSLARIEYPEYFLFNESL